MRLSVAMVTMIEICAQSHTALPGVREVPHHHFLAAGQ